MLYSVKISNDIRAYFDGIPNLFLVGRNGMHKYNNQDHSMLTAMAAVEHITTGKGSKDDISLGFRF